MSKAISLSFYCTRKCGRAPPLPTTCISTIHMEIYGCTERESRKSWDLGGMFSLFFGENQLFSPYSLFLGERRVLSPPYTSLHRGRKKEAVNERESGGPATGLIIGLIGFTPSPSIGQQSNELYNTHTYIWGTHTMTGRLILGGLLLHPLLLFIPLYSFFFFPLLVPTSVQSRGKVAAIFSFIHLILFCIRRICDYEMNWIKILLVSFCICIQK